MTRKFILLFLIVSLVPKPLTNAAIAAGDSLHRIEYKPGEILVKFRRTVSPTRRRNFHVLANSHLLAEIPLIGVQRIRIPEGMSVEQAVALYMQNPDVEYAEPNYRVHALATPNDPLLGNLWGLDNANDHDIDASAAWDITQGDEDVVIAVIDSGVAYDHPDLQANIWTNEAEANGIPGVDDDGNGYVDDIHGWDWVDNDNDPMDYYGHGTHVAGTIAAVGDNGRGVPGIMWRAKIMPLRFLDAEGSGWTYDAADAITYAVNNGAKILNNSWGGPGQSPTLEKAINLSNQSNLVFVAAAGNDASDNDLFPTYPASYSIPNIISVAATDQDDNLATF
ncbi:MAG: S8 family serine peptidase, partial [Deltaproteobacteria bacterium]|nr:S8 family serine peptidase [Deltaproteobacteria bacterium]